jgi:hypothetical protein
MTEIAFNQFMTICTVIGTGVGTVLIRMWQEGRQHTWDVEDRARTARDLEHKVQLEHDLLAMKLEVERQAAEKFRDTATAALHEVHAATGNAISAAGEAYREANAVNNKISDLNERLLQQGANHANDRRASDQVAPAPDLAPQILATATETKVIAEDIQRSVK